MLSYVKKYKKSIIVAGVLLLALGSWYVFSNRPPQEDPQRADLVYRDEAFEVRCGHYG